MHEVTSECDDLVQKSTYCYSPTKDGKRVSDGKNTFRRVVTLTLPLMFSPFVWLRHRYSYEDVVDTLNCLRSIHLWYLALLFGIQMSSSSIKIAFSTPRAMTFSSKAIIMLKIAQHLKQTYSFSNENKLDKQVDDHVPPLPVHRIHSNTYSYWKVRAQKQNIHMLTINIIKEAFQWQQLTLLPMWMEGDYIYMVRMVKRERLEESRRPIDSLVTQPIDIQYCGERWAGLTDEVMFFAPE
jgi:hypothetical protein